MIDTETQKQIDYVLDYFDFEKVHKTMEALDWNWSTTEGVPMIGELRSRARELLTEAVTKVKQNQEFGAGHTIATGGFRATANRYEDDPEKIYLRLSFEVADWDNYD